MTHVFISYVRENKEQVERLARGLRDAGLRIWLDRDDLHAGAKWEDVITKAIVNGAAFLACFSKDYVLREHTFMTEELQVARRLLQSERTERTWFVPIILDDCAPSDLNVLNDAVFARYVCVCMVPDWQDAFRRILAVLSPAQSMGRRLNRLPSRMQAPETVVPLLALDFGTSNSLLAWIGEDSTWHSIRDPAGRALHPSVITFSDTWDYWVGNEAVEAGAGRAERTVYNIKRLLAQDSEVQMDHKRFRAVSLAAIVIRYLRDCAEATFGKTVEAIVTAVPSGYSRAQSERLVKACELAGLKVIRIIPEPNAAGMVTFDYIRRHPDWLVGRSDRPDMNEAKIIVIDVGGGTSDISLQELVEVDGEWQVEVLASSGDNELGGIDYDSAVFDYLKDRFVKPMQSSVLRWTASDDQRLALVARQCKEALSRQERFEGNLSDVEVETGQLATLLMSVARDEFAEVVRALDLRLLQHVDKVVRASGASYLGSRSAVSAIVLAGQGSRSWNVRRLVQVRFPEIEVLADYQENAVSLGLANYALVLEGKCKNLLLLDALTIGVGIRCSRVAQGKERELICEIAMPSCKNRHVEKVLKHDEPFPTGREVLVRPINTQRFMVDVVELDHQGSVVSTIVRFEPSVKGTGSMLKLSIWVIEAYAIDVTLTDRDGTVVIGRHTQLLTKRLSADFSEQ